MDEEAPDSFYAQPNANAHRVSSLLQHLLNLSVIFITITPLLYITIRYYHI